MQVTVFKNPLEVPFQQLFREKGKDQHVINRHLSYYCGTSEASDIAISPHVNRPLSLQPSDTFFNQAMKVDLRSP